MAAAVEKLKELSEEDLVEFTNDCVRYLSGSQVPFITRYNERFGNSSALIAPCRSLMIELFQAVLRGSTKSSSIDAFKEAIKEHNEDIPDVLAAIIFSKR